MCVTAITSRQPCSHRAGYVNNGCLTHYRPKPSDTAPSSEQPPMLRRCHLGGRPEDVFIFSQANPCLGPSWTKSGAGLWPMLAGSWQRYYQQGYLEALTFPSYLQSLTDSISQSIKHANTALILKFWRIKSLDLSA